MRFFTALRNYFALNSAQRQFIGNGKRKFNMTKDEIVAFLKPMASFDLECDLAINQLFKINLTCFILFFCSGFIIGASAELGMIIGLVSFCTLIAGIFARIILGRIDIHNSLREFVLPLVVTLGEDSAAGKNMTLHLDLTGKLLKAKVISTKKDDPGWFSYPKVTTTIYKDYWFDLQTELIDGSKVRVTITDRITSRYKTYKAISGKIKSKTKNKLKQFIKGTVSLRNKKYSHGDLQTLKAGCDRFKEKEGQNRQRFTLTKILQEYAADSYPKPDICVALIGRIFMNAQPATAKGQQ